MIETDNEQIEIYGAREHNLKNIDVIIPRNKLGCYYGTERQRKIITCF
jgi:excinuclease ABC subunit A